MSAVENKLELVETTTHPPIIEHFERCRPWLVEALDGTFYTIDDVARALAENRAQLWPGKNAVIVTEINTYPSERVIQVWLAGGDMQEIMQMAAGLESWARLNGCSSVLVEGRKGWARTLNAQGYEPYTFTAIKRL